MPAPNADYDPAWNQVGRFAGYFAGIALLVEVALSLMDGLGVLGSAPPYRSTSAGAMQDEVTYWISFFAHQRQIDWDIFTRDSLQALANVALLALGLAVLNLVGTRRAIAQLAVASVALAAILNILDALAWLTLAQYWRGDWSQAPPEIMVAAGRDTQAIQNLTHLYTDMSTFSLAIGVFLLARLARPGGRLPSRLQYLAYAGALLLVLSLVAGEAQLDTANLALTIASVLVFPALLIWLARHFERLRLTEAQASGAQ